VYQLADKIQLFLMFNTAVFTSIEIYFLILYILMVLHSRLKTGRSDYGQVSVGKINNWKDIHVLALFI
jgi:hypothetical protein